jgi:DNA-binding transcriptional regulator YiaG
MTPNQLKQARYDLAINAGLGRGFKASEFARLMGLTGITGGETVIDYEQGKKAPSGVYIKLIEAYVKHGLPNDWRDSLVL